jgi:hypothetical protein
MECCCEVTFLVETPVYGGFEHRSLY